MKKIKQNQTILEMFLEAEENDLQAATVWCWLDNALDNSVYNTIKIFKHYKKEFAKYYPIVLNCKLKKQKYRKITRSRLVSNWFESHDFMKK